VTTFESWNAGQPMKTLYFVILFCVVVVVWSQPTNSTTNSTACSPSKFDSLLGVNGRDACLSCINRNCLFYECTSTLLTQTISYQTCDGVGNPNSFHYDSCKLPLGSSGTLLTIRISWMQLLHHPRPSLNSV
jgi:hypothetical protein